MRTLLKSSVSAASIAILLAGFGARARAEVEPVPSPSPSPNAVNLDPDQLRSLMISGNPSLLLALNQVYQAKDQVRIARNSLLPGANLDGILGSVTGPAFIMSAVEFLVPFLIPSNWFNYAASEKNFDAETLSYKILELNEYASVYALYETVAQDENLLKVLKDQYADWKEIVLYLQGENGIVAGSVNPQDIETARSEADSAAAQLSSMQQFILGDVAQLRYALGLPLSAQIVVDATSVPASRYEDDPVASAVKTAEDIAPEAEQLKDLIAAGGSGTWSDTFAWMNSLSFMAGNPYSPGGSALPDLTSGLFRGSMSIGFAAFPQYSLDQDKTAAIQISLNELGSQLTETLESTLSGVAAAKQQLADLQDAENQIKESYLAEKYKYDQGQSNIENLLTIRNQQTQASVARVNAQGQLDQLRITLQRTMLENEFGKLPGCLMTAVPSENVFQKIWNAIAGIFSGTHDHVTLDQVCQVIPGQQG